jgi:hypothetical protein
MEAERGHFWRWPCPAPRPAALIVSAELAHRRGRKIEPSRNKAGDGNHRNDDFSAHQQRPSKSETRVSVIILAQLAAPRRDLTKQIQEAKGEKAPKTLITKI